MNCVGYWVDEVKTQVEHVYKWILLSSALRTIAQDTSKSSMPLCLITLYYGNIVD